MPRPLGIIALIIFFLVGTLISFLAGLSLLFPSPFFESMWRVNPRGHEGLASDRFLRRRATLRSFQHLRCGHHWALAPHSLGTYSRNHVNWGKSLQRSYQYGFADTAKSDCRGSYSACDPHLS